MKSTYLIVIAAIFLFSCEKIIDLYPVSNLNTGTFYSNLAEMQAGMTGAYRGMQAPLLDEWALTELRSDNSKQGQTGSTSPQNRELNELDMFQIPTIHLRVYNYWLSTYNNIRNANVLLDKLGVRYDPVSGVTSLNPIDIPITDADRKQLAGEALFIRAYHYFNLVRLYGGMFVVHSTIGPDEALMMDRSSVADTYKFIQADLKAAAENMNTLRYNQVANANKGRATGWAAKTLLAKVYLTLNKKQEALTLLNDVRMNSGHGLVTSAGSAGNAYNNVFSTNNEVNEEIIFTIRYKSGGVGLGSRFPNMFGPLNTGSQVVPGDGQGLNFPTYDLDSTMPLTDLRKTISISRHSVGSTIRLFTRKYIVTTITNDGESDWPVLRFSDVLLMIAEAEGNTGNSINMINLVRTRAGITPINPAGITSLQMFEDTLANERRMEFAFENHRWFDLLRYGTTMSTVNVIDKMKEHFAIEYPTHYATYPQPALTLEQLQGLIIAERLLLPIPQRELDTNPRLQSQQNPGY
jgi:starch-binding outer membrane protein, SusD/RagB family